MGTRRYRIVSRSILTGLVMEGVATFSKVEAEAWLELLNKEWAGTLNHWLVEVVE